MAVAVALQCLGAMSPPRTVITPRMVAGLSAFGATAGPLVDAVHNQALLEYDVLPIRIGVFDAETSLLIPPLLALTYALLGSVLPAVAERVAGRGRVLDPPALSARSRAFGAVASTVVIIKLSEALALAVLPINAAVGALLACCLVQWAALDAAWSSLLLACVVGIGGPLAELPFLGLGCWHYLSPDYFPFGVGDELGINYITGPCYFAVTTDAIALGRWFASSDGDTP